MSKETDSQSAPVHAMVMRNVCEQLGFDPTNHHNAAKCPYCTPRLNEARKTPWDIAEAWYDEAGIARAIQQSGDEGFGSWEKIPEDVYSPEFAKWMTHQYRLAMAKGVQLGRDGSEDYSA